jgi:hypothetical protein
MAIPKVLGIETEYGIIVRGADSNPVSASSLLINAYISSISRKRGRIGWDFEDEQPSNDARGDSMDESIAPEVETTLVNAVLTNGARYYVDHAHPEISSPEVTTAREAVVWDRAADEIVRASMTHANAVLASDPQSADGAEMIIHKNNSDGKGNSYGCHENFLLSRDLPFGRMASQITPHFVTRQIFCGASLVVRTTTSATKSANGPTSSKKRSASKRHSNGRSSTPVMNRMPTRKSIAGST